MNRSIRNRSKQFDGLVNENLMKQIMPDARQSHSAVHLAFFWHFLFSHAVHRLFLPPARFHADSGLNP